MAKKKIVAPKPKTEKERISDELLTAQNRLEGFKKQREVADTIDKFKEYDFWVRHYTEVVDNLKKG